MSNDSIGFDPRGSVEDQLMDAAENGAAELLIESMGSAGVFVEWTMYDEDNRKTHPEPFEYVLALNVWSKGKMFRFGPITDVGREAEFYEPFYGFYCRKRDLVNCPDDADDAEDIVFALAHGEQDYNDSDDWRDPPKWWTRIGMPQQLGLDTEPRKDEA